MTGHIINSSEKATFCPKFPRPMSCAVVTHAVTLTVLLSFSMSIQQQYHCPLLVSIVQIINGLHSENVDAIAVIL